MKWHIEYFWVGFHTLYRLMSTADMSFDGEAIKSSQTDRLSKTLDKDFLEDEPKLTREQCGHLRHFHNLASLPDRDWSFMGSQDSLQEHDTSHRYQISCMAYAAGAAHYHRLPAMRSLFKPLIRKLISKMLRREVWGYWYMTSQSGIGSDPDIKELRKPWADPVCKENIMVSTSTKITLDLGCTTRLISAIVLRSSFADDLALLNAIR